MLQRKSRSLIIGIYEALRATAKFSCKFTAEVGALAQNYAQLFLFFSPVFVQVSTAGTRKGKEIEEIGRVHKREGSARKVGPRSLFALYRADPPPLFQHLQAIYVHHRSQMMK